MCVPIPPSWRQAPQGGVWLYLEFLPCQDGFELAVNAYIVAHLACITDVHLIFGWACACGVCAYRCTAHMCDAGVKTKINGLGVPACKTHADRRVAVDLVRKTNGNNYFSKGPGMLLLQNMIGMPADLPSRLIHIDFSCILFLSAINHVAWSLLQFNLEQAMAFTTNTIQSN